MHHRVGNVAFSDDCGKVVLKDCAPLCSDNWAVYIERISNDEIAYGVFSFEKSPTSLSMRDSMPLLSDELALLISRINIETVEIIGSKGSYWHLEFSTTRETHPDNMEEFLLFAQNCTSLIESPELSGDFLKYFSRLISEAALKSHGTILACSKEFESKKPAEIADAVLINPKLDFFEAFRGYVTLKSAESITHLSRIEDLLQGFLNCDGIVVFDELGRVVAYRAFFRSAVATEQVVGGARRRAFEGLRTLVGTSLISTLFRSQDGLTLYEGPQNGQ